MATLCDLTDRLNRMDLVVNHTSDEVGAVPFYPPERLKHDTPSYSTSGSFNPNPASLTRRETGTSGALQSTTPQGIVSHPTTGSPSSKV